MKRSDVAAIVLAAGRGTRMKSDLPKVVNEMGGRPLIQYVLDATFAAGVGKVIVVYGYRREHVSTAVINYPVHLAWQAEQKGTGHAVTVAAPLLTGHEGPVIVLAGDIPLIQSATLRGMVDHHRRAAAAVTVLTAEFPDPAGYGRIVRDAAGRVTGIVEEKDATPGIRAIREINSSIYTFDWRFLLPALARLSDDNIQREYYLTDTLQMAVREGRKVEAIKVEDPWEVSGINTVEQLRELEAAGQARGWLRPIGEVAS